MHRPEILTTIGSAYRIGTLAGFEPLPAVEVSTPRASHHAQFPGNVE